MSDRARGRPRAEATPFDDAGLTRAALALLDQEGEAGVTIRGVARQLGVTPMAVSHRTGGRDGLLSIVVAAAYASFNPPDDGAQGPDALAAALLSYAKAARRHPSAVLVLFSRPDLMPPVLATFTAWLRAQVARADPQHPDRGVALLVDYVHGHLLAAVRSSSETMEADFEANVRRLAAWVLHE